MKEPHNYRKVGYSMIVISVSLVAIGLIVWAIGDNYHYSSDLMAGQEVNSMTPKNGYNIISFDDSQPVGAKLKFLDHADTNATAIKLKEQHANSVSTILIFGTSIDENTKLVADTKLAAAQMAQEKTSISPTVEKTNQTTQNMSSTTNTPPVVNASVTTIVHGNESTGTSSTSNINNTTSSPTGQEALASTEKVNVTSTNTNQTNTNQTNTNQTNTNQTTHSTKSVNLNENIGVISK